MEIEHFYGVQEWAEALPYLTAVLVLILIGFGVYRHYRMWVFGGQKIIVDNLLRRLAYFAKYAILQGRVVRRRYAGFMHLLVYGGMAGLLLGTVLRFIEADITLTILDCRYLVDGVYKGFKLMLNLAGLALVGGVLLALGRRAFKKPQNLPQGWEDSLTLLLILFVAVTGFTLTSILDATLRGSWNSPLWDPVGYGGGILLAGLGFTSEQLSRFYFPLWVIHLSLAMAAIALIPYTKLFHLLVGPLNIFLLRLQHPAVLKPIKDLEKLAGEGAKIGVNTVGDLTWKQRLDLDACIKCSRCVEECPANLSGKPLSPMNVIVNLRKEMCKGNYGKNLVGSTLSEEELWSCTTCGACVQKCPMLIHQVETIIDVRRYLALTEDRMPEALKTALYNIMKVGNPYGFPKVNRQDWLKKLASEIGAEVAREGVEYEFIYWIGCVTSYDPKLRSIAESVMRLLKAAGVSFGVLAEEKCCGDPARRAGDEYLFQVTALQNIDLLRKYRFKKLLLHCPHGLNTFQREYTQVGAKFDAVHHSQLILQLLTSGRIKPRKKAERHITYHDPCYLGRYDRVFDEPREVIKAVEGLKLSEMVRKGEKSLCCGGGGGHAFFEIKTGKRISKLRVEEAARTGAKTIVTACPFCNLMLRPEAENIELEVRDLAEIAAESCGDQVR